MNKVIVHVIATGAAFILNMILTPILISISHKNGWYDSIDDRKIHTGSIPRLGGISIFISFLIVVLTIFIVAQFHIPMPGPVLVIFLIILAVSNILGLIDDFTNLRPRYKLLLQFVISIFLVSFGFRFRQIILPFTNYSIQLGIFSYPITFLWIIGVTNAINLIDGVDGLAGGVTLISLVGFVIFFHFLSVPSGMIVSLVMIGSLAGFLFFNFPPARIFMGDSGSLLLGTAVAIIPLIFPGPKMFFAALTATLIPVTDTIFAVVRRSISRKPFYMPDKNHIHHILLNLGLNARCTMLVLCLYAAVQVAVASIWFVSDHILASIGISTLWIFNIVILVILNKVNIKKQNN